MNIKEILNICKKLMRAIDLTQNRLAEKINKNQSLISQVLNGKVEKEEEQIAIIQGILDYIPRRYPDEKLWPQEIKELVNTIKQHNLIQKGLESSQATIPGKPLHPDCKEYMIRESDESLEVAVQGIPFGVNVTAGPKMGRTSIYKRLSRKLETMESSWLFFYLDCREIEDCATLPEVYRWLAKKVEEQLGKEELTFSVVLNGPELFMEWLRDDIMPHIQDKNPVLAFDNFESIPNIAFSALLDNLHHVSNQRFRNRLFNKLSFLMISDESDPRFEEALTNGSRLLRSLQPIELERLNQRKSNDFIYTLLDAENVELEIFAWQHFAGHPCLTHFFVEHWKTNNEEKPEKRMAQSLNATGESINEIIQRLNDRWGETFSKKVWTMFQEHSSETSNYNVIFRESELVRLYSSGLFSWKTDEINWRDGVVPATLWLKEALYAFFKTTEKETRN